jgi:two-component system sensor histidine kinase BaeS
MLDTLRRRLILSHTLPLLVIIPLMGIALIYVLETRVLLPQMVDELTGDAALIARTARRQASMWDDTVAAQAFLDDISPDLNAHGMLLSTDGHLLASTEPADAVLLGQRLNNLNLNPVLAGNISRSASYNQRLGTQVADVLVPVQTPDGQVIGIVRLTHRLASVYGQFVHLRYLIAGVMVVGLALGLSVGSLLAVGLAHPLQRVTQAVHQLAADQRLMPLSEQGPAEIRLLSRTVNILAERRRSLEKATRQLLSNLVHELGRPLGACQSAIQALQNGAVEDAALRDELLAGMASETKRLQRLLDDLARLHDRTLGQLELDRQPVPLSDWLPQMLSPWREAAKLRSVKWGASVPADLPILEVDPDRLGQSLGNLLSNAIKYTPSGGRVSVAAGIEDDEVWIRIRDTGPGIAPEDQERIFAPFYRAAPDDDHNQGMGLGLSIARDLVMAHGGRLEVESALGQGSDFILWLPLTSVSLIDEDHPRADFRYVEPSKIPSQRTALSTPQRV